jgi:hypothetical protein
VAVRGVDRLVFIAGRGVGIFLFASSKILKRTKPTVQTSLGNSDGRNAKLNISSNAAQGNLSSANEPNEPMGVGLLDPPHFDLTDG